jgi:hypothetical protein
VRALDLLLRTIALGLAGLSWVAVAVMLRTFRRARALRPAALRVSIAVGLLVLALYSALLGVAPPAAAVVLGVPLGLLAGVLSSRTRRLFLVDGEVQGQGGILSLAVWGLTLALNQAVIIGTGHAPRALLGFLVVGTAMAVGGQLSLLRRVRRLREGAPAAIPLS